MAQPLNTVLTTAAANANREDLSDVIYNVSPVETPFASGISRGKATGVLHEWQTDTLAAAAYSPQLEGDDATADSRAATSRPSNYCSIFRKVISVSGTQRAVKNAGYSDQLEYEVAKAGREMKRDIELALLGTQVKSTITGATATARQLGGVATWLSTNRHHVSSTSTTPGGGATIVVGNAAGITITTATQLQTPLNTVIEDVWTNGGDPGVIMVSGQGKRVLSKLPGIATMYRDVPPKSQGQIIAGADVYVSDFGTHAIVPSRQMPTAHNIYVLDMDYWGIAELRGMQTIPLAKTGDSDRTMLITELTLVAKNEAASGKVYAFVYA